MSTNTTRLTGYAAIEYAAECGLTLNKYADPIEAAKRGITVAKARDIAADDPSLVYLDVEDDFDADF